MTSSGPGEGRSGPNAKIYENSIQGRLLPCSRRPLSPAWLTCAFPREFERLFGCLRGLRVPVRLTMWMPTWRGHLSLAPCSYITFFFIIPTSSHIHSGNFNDKMQIHLLSKAFFLRPAGIILFTGLTATISVERGQPITVRWSLPLLISGASLRRSLPGTPPHGPLSSKLYSPHFFPLSWLISYYVQYYEWCMRLVT